MKIQITLVVLIARLARAASRLTRGHGGSALPGLVAEKLMPSFLERTLAPLAGQIVVVIGTNGKTTTTKVITELLDGQGRRVLTNPTGSNFTRGIASSVVANYRLGSGLPYDAAVLELDEVYATHFIKKVAPDYVIALNVMRDQLDRYGELQKAHQLIATTVRAARRGAVLNANEPAFIKLGSDLSVPVHYFGANAALAKLFPTDEQLLALKNQALTALPPLTVALTAFDDQSATYLVAGNNYTLQPQLRGAYNYHNLAGALTVALTVMPKVATTAWLNAAAKIKPAFGRGESIKIDGRELELVLVKNPGGFRQAMGAREHAGPVMIAINDEYADGRDVSWLWDVDFKDLQAGGAALTTGIRAYDMALRLSYDDVAIAEICPDLDLAVDKFITLPGDNKRIFATYTAMLKIRELLAKRANLEVIL